MSLNMLGILMICGQDNSAGEEVFEYLREIDEKKAEESFASGSRLVNGSRRMTIMVVHRVFIFEWSRVLSVLGGSQ